MPSSERRGGWRKKSLSVRNSCWCSKATVKGVTAALKKLRFGVTTEIRRVKRRKHFRSPRSAPLSANSSCLRLLVRYTLKDCSITALGKATQALLEVHGKDINAELSSMPLCLRPGLLEKTGSRTLVFEEFSCFPDLFSE